MEDNQIIDLYFARSEAAIAQTAAKYGNYCYRIADNILSSREDAQECVNDTYLAAWNAMPPKRPGILSAFLGKITRNISLDRWKRRAARKRGGGEAALSLEELDECLTGGQSPEREVERRELLRAINRFLDTLPETQRDIFVCRYWYLDSIEDIGARLGYSQSKVTTILFRLRKKLAAHLEKEGLQ